MQSLRTGKTGEQIKKVKFRQGVKNLKDQFLLETEGISLVYNN